MRYLMPNYPCEFEIPDAWLAEAGLEGFVVTKPAYRSTREAALVPLRDIEPPYRTPSTKKDWRGFDRARLVSVLKGILTDAEIEPVPLHKYDGYSDAQYDYRLNNGYHRFFASIIVGFEYRPAAISWTYRGDGYRR